jgi:hypothetical protein
MISKIIDLLMIIFMKMFQTLFLGAWALLASMILIIIVYHLFNVIK